MVCQISVSHQFAFGVLIQISDERKAEVSTLSSQLIQALSITQGVALNHQGSKQYLGRRYALEVCHLLLDYNPFLTTQAHRFC